MSKTILALVFLAGCGGPLPGACVPAGAACESADCCAGYECAKDVYTDGGVYVETIAVDGGGICTALKR